MGEVNGRVRLENEFRASIYQRRNFEASSEQFEEGVLVVPNKLFDDNFVLPIVATFGRVAPIWRLLQAKLG